MARAGGTAAVLRRLHHELAAAQDAEMRIEGVMLWTGIDNREWLAGFDVPFGLLTPTEAPWRSAQFIQTVTTGR